MLTAKLAPTCSRFRYRLYFSYILVKKSSSSDAFINSFNTGRIYLCWRANPIITPIFALIKAK